VTATHRQGGALLEYEPVRVAGLGRAGRVLNGVETLEFVPIVGSRGGEEHAAEFLSWDEVLDVGLVAHSSLLCAPAGSGRSLGCGYEIQSMSSKVLLVCDHIPQHKCIKYEWSQQHMFQTT
jgi:hypothetical protein